MTYQKVNVTASSNKTLKHIYYSFCVLSVYFQNKDIKYYAKQRTKKHNIYGVSMCYQKDAGNRAKAMKIGSTLN